MPKLELLTKIYLYRVTPDGLVIRNITQNDKGAYKCKATQIGEDITDFQDMIIQLRVQRK